MAGVRTRKNVFKRGFYGFTRICTDSYERIRIICVNPLNPCLIVFKSAPIVCRATLPLCLCASVPLCEKIF